MFQVIGTIIFGAVIGLIARIVMPGKQPYGMIVTILLGVVGALIGYWVWGLIGGGNTFGIDWIRWAISVAAAAVLSFGYMALTRKAAANRTHRVPAEVARAGTAPRGRVRVVSTVV